MFRNSLPFFLYSAFHQAVSAAHDRRRYDYSWRRDKIQGNQNRHRHHHRRYRRQAAQLQLLEHQARRRNPAPLPGCPGTQAHQAEVFASDDQHRHSQGAGHDQEDGGSMKQHYRHLKFDDASFIAGVVVGFILMILVWLIQAFI